MTPERYRNLRAALARRQPDLTLLVETLTKPHNVAAVIRTADAVGVHELNVVGSPDNVLRRRRVAGGVRRWVGIRTHATVSNAISHLKNNNFQIIAAHFSGSAKDFRSLDYSRPTALLIGSELRGVSPEAARLADHHAVIPMHGLAASLNVSVAVAVFLYEAARQRERAGFYDNARLAPAAFERTLFEWCHPAVAARCRQLGIAYPPLTDDGSLAFNPLQESGRSSVGSGAGGGTGAGGAP